MNVKASNNSTFFECFNAIYIFSWLSKLFASLHGFCTFLFILYPRPSILMLIHRRTSIFRSKDCETDSVRKQPVRRYCCHVRRLQAFGFNFAVSPRSKQQICPHVQLTWQKINSFCCLGLVRNLWES